MALTRWVHLTAAFRHNRPSSNVKPSTEVTRAEDSAQAESQHLGTQLNKLSLDQTLPFRPGYGTIGKQIVVWANYIEMAAKSDLTLYRYDMSVSPAVVGRKLKQIIRQVLESAELAEYKGLIVSDFKSTLISGRKLGEEEILINILYRMEQHDEPRPGAPTYTVRLLLTNTLTVGELVNHLSTSVEKQPTIQALNILLNHRSRIEDNLVAVGSNRTFSLGAGTETYSLGAGLLAVRGFFASVRAATARILVNVNVSHGVFYRTGPLIDVMREYHRTHSNLAGLNSFVSKLRVILRHLPSKKNSKGQEIHRIKTVLGLATPNDGRGLDHPPRVPSLGATAKSVQFWMERPTGGNQPPSAAGARYISVYNYFHQGQTSSLFAAFLER